jgi:hypothetical protein
MDIPGPASGYATGDAKIAAFCNKFKLAFQPSTALPLKAFANWPQGISEAYAAISAADAYAAIAGAPTGMASADCASVPALDVTAARLGPAAFQTDRGTAQMTAWLFTVTGALGDVIYPAIVPSAFWGHLVTNGSFDGGATVSADGRSLTYRFIGGECDAGYKSAVAESPTAVAVEVVAIPKGGMSQYCSAVGIARSITVSLASPLGGRVLVDASGRVEAASPISR